jgi:glycosyltransferase involved in cell wall biosynthesis
VRVLFVPTYRHDPAAGTATASDALGFGVTCCDALIAGLRQIGLDVRVLSIDRASPGGGARGGPGSGLGSAIDGGQTAWLAGALRAFDRAMAGDSYDAVLAFHAFWPFTSDLRRIMADRDRHCPLITYTHGSHWDPTDLFRFERYPELRWTDLGNLLAADRVLTVSHYMSRTLVRTVRRASREAAAELDSKLRTVGLPLDVGRIDAAARPNGGGGGEPVTVVFNHSMTAAKRPEVFLAVAAEVLRQSPARILLTRHVPAGSPYSDQIADLRRRYPGRLLLGRDLPIDEYYSWLWASDVQVSTAVHESLGVATLEAMATRTFCLLPRIGAYPEIAAADPRLLYDDQAELCTRLIRLANSAVALAAAAGAAASHAERVRASYAPERIASNVRDVIADAARSR